MTVSVDDAVELACRAHMGVWSEVKRGFTHAPVHWEWSELRMTRPRLAVVAPREHAKTETFTVNGTVWESRYTPGLWTYVFAQTGGQAEEWLDRVCDAMYETHPWMMENARGRNKTEVTFANWSRVNVAGAGKAVRGAHPDRIVGDDVLSEANTMTKLQRDRTQDWWLGTVGGMAHPGTSRHIGRGEASARVSFSPTRVFLVGTPFHQQDLLMGMRDNPMYEFRRYAAECEPDDLADGMAIEVG